MKGLRAIAPLYAEPVHFLVAKGSGIKSIKDLKGKRVSVARSEAELRLRCARFCGRTASTPTRTSARRISAFRDTASAFADKHIDAGLTVGALGIAGIVEIMTVGTAELIDFEPAVIESLCKELPYYLPFEIPANTYKGQEKPIKAMASWNVLITNDKLDEETAYQMTKALYDKKEDILNVSSRLSSMPRRTSSI